jgi:membrane protease YdiL (CAAX protease family)
MSKETRTIIVFLFATFAMTWACYTPIAVTGNSPYEMPWMALLTLGGMAPSAVGVLMVLFTYNKDQRRDYWKRCFSFRRIKGTLWAFIIILFPLIMSAAVAVDTALGGSLPEMQQLKALMANPITWPLAAFISFMSGPWSEEFGWRGVVLDPMMKRFGRIPGTVVLGLIWGVWHLPLFFMPATAHGKMGFGLDGFWTFLLFNVGMALLMTWVYVQTNRSILSAMLMHFTSNFTAQLVYPFSTHVEVYRTAIILALGLVLCILMERQPRLQEQPI